MSNRKDDFSAKTKQTLAERVGFRCSKPDCSVGTIGPHSDPCRSSNVGEAAHITAASPGGARYDATLTSEQRKDISNGIWLCELHGKEIDNDEERYPVELLNEWKREAELKAQITTTPGYLALDTHKTYQTQISQLTETVQRLTLMLPTAPATELPTDARWKTEVERALKWSESGEVGKVQVVQELVVEIRRDADFLQASLSLQSRLATAAAVAAINLGDEETADREVREAFRLAPDNIKCLSNMAAVAIMRNEYERAATLAEQVLTKDAQNENAALVLLQAWHHTNKPDLVEAFLRENTWLLELPNGCAVNAQIHSNENRFNEAIHFAKLALKKDKNHIHALEVLYDAIFSPLRDRVLSSEDWDYSLRTRRKLQRAEAAVTRAIKNLEKLPNKERLHRGLSNRAAVRSALEKTDLAFSDIDRILNDDPSEENHDIANLNKGMILIHVGRGAEAALFLQALTTERWKTEGMFALAYSFHVKGQADKAIEIWESLWKPEICDAQQMMTASLLLWVYRRTNNDTGADSVLERIKQFHPDHYEVQYLEAQDKYVSGDAEDAIEMLQVAAESCLANHDHAGRIKILMSMSDILYRTNKIKEAVEIWKEIGWERLHPPHRDAFLNALYWSGELPEALIIAKAIRQQLGFVPRAAEIEAAIYAYRGDHESAYRIWQELAHLEPQNHLHKINCANAALNVDNKENAIKALDEISFENIKDDADLLRRVSELQSKVGHREAIRFAFRARQIEFGEPESHRNYANVFLRSTESFSYDENGVKDDQRASDVLGLNGPKLGEVPCTIRLLPVGVTDDRQYQSFTILAEGPFDHPRGVYSSTHEFAKRLLSLKAEDSISLKEELSRRQPPTDDDRQYQVSTYLSPYVHAFQESIKVASRLFGAEAEMASIDIRGNLDKLWNGLEESGRGLVKLTQLYRQRGCPLSSIGVARSRSILDIWYFLSSELCWGVGSAADALTQFYNVVETLKARGDRATLVLDATALISIVQLDITSIVSSHFRLLIPQSLYAEVNEWCSASTANHVPADIPNRILSFVEGATEQLEVNTGLIPPSDLKKWQRFVGDSEIDAALLALEHGALVFAEDAVYRTILKIQTEVESVSTHHILEYLQIQDYITPELYEEKLTQMADVNIQIFAFQTE